MNLRYNSRLYSKIGTCAEHVRRLILFDLIFLGTSASAPSIHRGLSASIVLYKDYRFLIDCGEGTQRQLLKSGLGFRRLNKIILTHGHLDHILGLGGLVSTFARWEAMPYLEIYGGAWALERVQALMAVVLGRGDPPLDIRYFPVKEGVILEDRTFELSAFPVSHRGPACLGYNLQEKEKRAFLAEKAEDLGVPAGPCRRELVQGRAITLEGGTTIHPDQVLGKPQAGVKLSFVGDAGRTDNLLRHVTDADGLVIEATYLSQEADLAREFGHLTAAQSAELALQANVNTLYLTHISRRYREKDILQEAQAIFPQTVVARDFDSFRIVKSS